MKLTSNIAATLLVLALGSSAYAAKITGGLSLSGGYTVSTGNLNTATGFTSFFDVEAAGAGTGSFAPIANNTTVTMNVFSWNPFPVTGVTPLWSVVVLGNTYSFDLSSPLSVNQGNNQLSLVGTGMLKITGFDNTPGTWIFTANQGGQPATFSFSSSNGANVPDGGATVALLGLSFLGLGGVSRFVRRK